MNSMTWLSVSLFCEKKNWHKLLEGTSYFLKVTHNLIVCFRIEFNAFCGENLRLCIQTYKDKATELLYMMDNYYREYFKSQFYSNKANKQSYKGVFMHFPVNTIQFGLFSTDILSEYDAEYHLFSDNLSEIMLSAFKEEIDDEIILSFCYYLNVAMAKAAISNGIHLKDFLPDAAQEAGNIGMLETDSVISDIAEEVMQNEVFDADLYWINSWYSCCYSHFLRLKSCKTNDRKKTGDDYLYLFRSLCNQLGIAELGAYSVLTWTKSSLTEYLNKQKNRDKNI